MRPGDDIWQPEWMTPAAPVEPASDIRLAAKAVRETFVSLVNEGFTEEQALTMVCAMLPRVGA